MFIRRILLIANNRIKNSKSIQLKIAWEWLFLSDFFFNSQEKGKKRKRKKNKKCISRESKIRYSFWKSVAEHKSLGNTALTSYITSYNSSALFIFLFFFMFVVMLNFLICGTYIRNFIFCSCKCSEETITEF